MTTTRPVSRRSFLRASTRLAAGAALTSVTGGLYAVWLEPQWIAVESLEIRVPRLPAAFDGFRIAQLSDLHYDSTPPDTITAAVDAANQLDADLIVLTGDYVTRSRRSMTECAGEISRLSARHGVFGVLGNHDWWVAPRTVVAALEAHSVAVLSNRSMPIERDGARLWMVGADDVGVRRADLDRALQGVPAGEAKVLLVHEPDFADAASVYPVDLQLSGHSHGGQVRLPGIGALYLPRLGRKYPIGLQRAGRLPVYTTRGVGMVQPSVRFNCRPEVTSIILHSAA